MTQVRPCGLVERARCESLPSCGAVLNAGVALRENPEERPLRRAGACAPGRARLPHPRVLVLQEQRRLGPHKNRDDHFKARIFESHLLCNVLSWG